jgi:hypothetical protein
MSERKAELELAGYYVLDVWGNIKHGRLFVHRSSAGEWLDSRRGMEVSFQEADDLPGEEDHGGRTFSISDGSRSLYRPSRDSVRGVTAVYENEGAFVLDAASVERLKAVDRDCIDWLPRE